MMARTLLVGLLLGALAGCEGEAPAPAASGDAATTSTATASPTPGAKEHVGRRKLYKVLARLDPEPPPMSKLFAVEVTLLDLATGAPVEDAQVSIDAKMPQHGHGMSTQPINEPAEGCAEGEACPHPGGVYRTTGMKFHMPGAWTIEIDVVGPKGTDRVVFVYEMPA